MPRCINCNDIVKYSYCDDSIQPVWVNFGCGLKPWHANCWAKREDEYVKFGGETLTLQDARDRFVVGYGLHPHRPHHRPSVRKRKRADDDDDASSATSSGGREVPTMHVGYAPQPLVGPAALATSHSQDHEAAMRTL